MPKVLGVTSGIGSLQYGFDKAGWDIGPSHEWRTYYNTGTFEENYGERVHEEYEPLSGFQGVDCIVSHPECGNYSNLNTGVNRKKRQKDPGDIFKFTELANQYQPKVFLVDNLPTSLKAVSKEEWQGEFLDYKIYFEYVSNWGYGNVQKYRKRLFIIGVHRDLDWRFVPREHKHDLVLRDVLSDIPEDCPNHQKMQLDEETQWQGYQIGKPEIDRKLKLIEMQDWMQEAEELGGNLPYYNKKGEKKRKPGYSVVDLDRFGMTLSGGGGLYDNHWFFDEEELYYRPYTMRERLRIQGFDDDFTLIPRAITWGEKDHQSCIKQTGKCMPVQFPYEFARQLKEFLDNGVFPDHEPSRLLKQI